MVFSKEKIPVLDICNMVDASETEHEILVFELADFLAYHNNMQFPHRHNFYQLMFIESGSGYHIIDFTKFEIKENTIYFLNPGQVHEWQFDYKPKGILINFTESYISLFLANLNHLKNYPFFIANGNGSVVNVESISSNVQILFKQIKHEYARNDESARYMLRLYLLQLLEWMSRPLNNVSKPYELRQGANILQKFDRLIEEHYTTLRLPKDYAAMLYITPNYLNELCISHFGHSAGTHIRNRIILEDKRLLVNSSLTINEIAWALNFENHSYFSRFFKKYTSITPELFRKQISNTKSCIY
jgi:AraC-like DNA-binding protein